jgi:hypothetical protein
MSSEDTLTEKDCCGPKWRGVGSYFFLLSVQTVGVALLLANLIPLYRLMATDFANYAPDPRTWWAFTGMAMVQIAYWLRVRLQPAMPRAAIMLLGHIVSFVGRISFVAVTAAFTDMFLKRFESLSAMDYPPLRALAVLIMFFTIFCWTLELERLAKALQGSKT